MSRTSSPLLAPPALADRVVHFYQGRVPCQPRRGHGATPCKPPPRPLRSTDPGACHASPPITISCYAAHPMQLPAVTPSCSSLSHKRTAVCMFTSFISTYNYYKHKQYKKRGCLQWYSINSPETLARICSPSEKSIMAAAALREPTPFLIQ